MLYLISVEEWIGVAVMIALMVFGILFILFPESKMEVNDNIFYDEIDEPQLHHTKDKDNCLIYYGDQLDLSEEEIKDILLRHFIFYSTLDNDDKQKFITRLTSFMDDKVFKIHDESGFKEMPVLISATAIQVSFGLEEYLLPHFIYIHIYPEEYIGVHPTIRFLEGNVSGNRITISWKYFLDGFRFPQDGKNVGLHEMAHAYYYQNFGPCEIKDSDFINAFTKFNECGNKVYTSIQDTALCLYSGYAKKNFQEFWAESLELFFEKPMEVKTTYPVLYESLCDVLNQDPVKNFS
ncbi:MAG: zinc-dependent peptidase [Chitinophagaceae bacterium]|nr:zinc-dependent peptidase [Chitinophagaceae bacterium]